MTRRAIRRRYAILGALHEHGPQLADELAKVLRCGHGTLYPDLAVLECDGLIVGDQVAQPYGRPDRRRYRVTSAEERAAAARPVHGFWGDLKRRMDNPEFRKAYIEESLRIQAIDAAANAEDGVS